MLLNNFYSIEQIEKGGDGFTAKVKLNKSHTIYEGHFPGNPIVPGVCLTQIIKELIEKELGQELRMVKADNIKFLNFVDPFENEILLFSIEIKKSEQIQIKATITFEEKTFLKFAGTFK